MRFGWPMVDTPALGEEARPLARRYINALQPLLGGLGTKRLLRGAGLA